VQRLWISEVGKNQEKNRGKGPKALSVDNGYYVGQRRESLVISLRRV